MISNKEIIWISALVLVLLSYFIGDGFSLNSLISIARTTPLSLVLISAFPLLGVVQISTRKESYNWSIWSEWETEEPAKFKISTYILVILFLFIPTVNLLFVFSLYIYYISQLNTPNTTSVDYEAKRIYIHSFIISKIIKLLNTRI